MPARSPRPLSARPLARWLPLGLLPALYLLFFFRLGAPVLHLWDEGRLAINAAELLESDDWLVLRYQGQPDLWNTKPPLMVWLQAISLQLFGYGTFAVRLPSALAAAGTAGLLYWFGSRAVGSRLVGLAAALILATSPGFNGLHVARTGDYDSLLALCLTGTGLFWYRYLHTAKPRYGLAAGLWLALALLTKSAAALLLLPGLLLYPVLTPAARWPLRQVRTYAVALLAFVPLATYYVAREIAGPGYLSAVWFNDWYGRFAQHIVKVQYPWWIYMQRLLFPGLLGWVLLLPGGAYLALARNTTGRHQSGRRAAARYVGICAGVFLVIITVARTRLPWYSAPAYPLLALLCALALERAARWLAGYYSGRWIAWGLCGLGLAQAAVLLAHEWQRPVAELQDPDLRFDYMLPLLPPPPALPIAFTILEETTYSSPLEFQLLILRQKGFRPRRLYASPELLRQLPIGRPLMVCSAKLQHYIQLHYRFRLLSPAANPCRLVELLERR